tara:strand:- start:216 stop:428 length:213 start_codon:yes stop_codon:yes gene_type:complete
MQAITRSPFLIGWDIKMRELRDVMIDYTLDYINNYLTVGKFAEHNGLTEEQATNLLIIGKVLLNSNHPES